MRVAKKGLTVQRVVLSLGSDQFAIDADGEVFRNGYGQVFTKDYLAYTENGIKKRIPFREFFDMVFVENLEVSEALRRIRLRSMIPTTKRERLERVQKAFRAKRMSVIRSDGRVADSMTKAAKKLGCTTAAISKSVKTGGKVKGYTFQLLTKRVSLGS